MASFPESCWGLLRSAAEDSFDWGSSPFALPLLEPLRSCLAVVICGGMWAPVERAKLPACWPPYSAADGPIDSACIVLSRARGGGEKSRDYNTRHREPTVSDVIKIKK